MVKMQKVVNEKCFISNEDLDQLICLNNMPIHFGTTLKEKSSDEFMNQVWKISQKSGIVQLQERVPLEKLYPEQTTVVAVGSLWQSHHKAFADFIINRIKPLVLEIGGAHGILSKNVLEKKPSTRWSIVEPNPAPSHNIKANFIPEFFSQSTILPYIPDLVVHSHTIEHSYDPIGFLKTIYNIHNDHLEMIFSIPDLTYWVKNNFLNALNFEHSYFLSEDLMDSLLSVVGFKILSKETFGQNHSIFYHVIKCSPGKFLYIKNQKSLVLDFFEYYQNIIFKINKKLETQKSKVFLFGAHIFSQFLLSNGLNESKITLILDNDTNKHNRRLYGTNLFVESPKILKGLQDPVVILKAGSHQNDIKKDLLSINNSVIIEE